MLSLGLLSLLWVSTAAAQSEGPEAPTTEESAPEVSTGSSEVDATPPAEDAPVDTQLTYDLFGYLRVAGAVIQNDPSVPFVGRSDGFLLQNARLGIQGTWRDRLRFKISADGAQDERPGANALNGTLRFGLRDAYADVLLHPMLEVRAGQFYATFDVDETTSTTQRRFIDRALASRGVEATRGWETPGLRPGRSLGVALRSESLIRSGEWGLGYELAFQNGTAENIASNDNDSLAYTAALLVDLPGEGRLFAAARHNRRTEGDLPAQETEEDLAASLGGRVALGSLGVVSQAVVRRTQFPTVGGAAEVAFGGHAAIYWRWRPRKTFWIEPVYRFGFYEPSDLIEGDQLQEHTAGVNIGLPQWHSRLQAGFTHVVEETARTLNNDRFETVIEVSF
jgi:hypothetical protein